jgi:hypothetical protein
VSSCSSAKKVNSSPKAEKSISNKNSKLSPTPPPPVDECEAVSEEAKASSSLLPVLSEPEAEVVEAEAAVAAATKASKSKTNKKLGRQNTVAAIHNENLSQQRKNYLNQHKSQLRQSKTVVDEAFVVKQQQQQVKFKEDKHQQQAKSNNPLSIYTNNTIRSINQGGGNNKVTADLVASSAILSPGDLKRSNSNSTGPEVGLTLGTHSTQHEKVEIEMLNNQLQQLQEQNKQQLQEINYLGCVGKVASSDSSASPSPNSTSSNSSAVCGKKQVQEYQQQQNRSLLGSQTGLFDIILSVGGTKQQQHELTNKSNSDCKCS